MNGELGFDDILYFPEEIVTEKIADDILVISVTTANWIVLKNEFQLSLLNKLREGLMIGQVVEDIEWLYPGFTAQRQNYYEGRRCGW